MNLRWRDVLAYYEGRNGCEHYIKIYDKLIYHDVLCHRKRHTLNSVMLHELRHVYWNIVKPCLCKGEKPFSKDFDLRNRCWKHNGDDGAKDAEEKECDIAAEQYKDFSVFKKQKNRK